MASTRAVRRDAQLAAHLALPDRDERLPDRPRDSAIVISESAILFAGETEVSDDVRKVDATWVLEKRDGQWLIAAYHNSPVLAPAK